MADKIKILIVTDEMEVGGTQRQIVNLLSNINKDKFEVELLFFINSSYLVDELRSAGIKVTQIIKRKGLDLKFLIELIGFVKSNRFSLIHAFALSAEFWSMLAVLFSKNTKFVSSIRGVYEWYGVTHWLMKTLISMKSGLIISNSLSGASYLNSKVWNKNNVISVIHNGIELKQGYKDSYRKDATILRCLFVGRIIDGKNLRLLIDAIDSLSQENINIRVTIAGDGPDLSSLKEYSGKLEAGLIEFLGQVDNVTSLMLKSDLLIHPSLREGLSNSILEAMYSGLPVLVSSADGNLELVSNNKTGFVFENNVKDSLVNQIFYIYHNYQHAIECAKYARDWVRVEFSINNMCDQFEQKYMEVVDEN